MKHSDCHQIVFRDKNGYDYTGILLPNGTIIDMETGRFFDRDKLVDFHIFSNWIDVSYEISDGYTVDDFPENY